MTMLVLFFSILGSILVGAISPGPSFVLVSKAALESSRLSGLATAAGLGLGGFIFSLLALFGLVALLEQVEWLYLLLRVVGGIYLLYLAFTIWHGAKKPLTLDIGKSPIHRSTWQYFWVGLLTQVANPKTAVVYAGIFAVFLPSNPSLVFLSILPPAVFIVEAGWYSLVAIVLSSNRPQQLYFRGKKWIDRSAATIPGFMGTKLISDAAR